MINFDKVLEELELEVYMEYCAENENKFDRQIARALMVISDADAVSIVQAKHLAELLCSIGCPYKNSNCDVEKCITSIKKFQEFLENNMEKHQEWFITS